MTKIFPKILVIGGIHGNEPLGIELVKKINLYNIPNIDAMFGNLLAIEKNTRFVEQDLNRVFDLPEADSLEKVRVREILKFIKEGCYDLVIDFHNTTTPNNNCTFVGNNCDSILFDVSGYLGLSNVIIADYSCINNNVQNCISIEISLDSKLNNPAIWLDKVIELSNQVKLPQNKSINKFKYVRRITKKEKRLLRLDEWESFNVISNMDKQKFGLGENESYFPIFVNEVAYLPNNYAGLLTKLS
jgi:Succinylglutamate desuccinylase / Aspartoacylase family